MNWHGLSSRVRPLDPFGRKDALHNYSNLMRHMVLKILKINSMDLLGYLMGH